MPKSKEKKSKELTEEGTKQSKKLRAMFTNQIPNVPLGEYDKFDITKWDYSKEPPRPLTAQEVGKLTVEQKREYFTRAMLENLNNLKNHDKSI